MVSQVYQCIYSKKERLVMKLVGIHIEVDPMIMSFHLISHDMPSAHHQHALIRTSSHTNRQVMK